MTRLRVPSPAMCVALLGLFVALGGTTWAAVSLPAYSVGTQQLKANAVTGGKVKNHSLTGADILLSRLGRVPLATRSATADAATHATSADSATVAGTAYSTHFEAAVVLKTAPAVVATLTLPAGSYVLTAKAQIDTIADNDIVECDLVAGTNADKSFVQGGTAHQSQILTNSLVQQFTAPGPVQLSCLGLAGGSVSQVRLTAIQVANVVNSP
jgi:hypothetical protein